MHLVVVGDALVDERWDARGMRAFVGGAGLDAAAGLRRLGHAVTLVAAVGDDARGMLIRRGVAAHDVALRAVPVARSGHRLNGRDTIVAHTDACVSELIPPDGDTPSVVLTVSDRGFRLDVDGVAEFARGAHARLQLVIDGDAAAVVDGSTWVAGTSVDASIRATTRLRGPYADPTGTDVALAVVLVDALLVGDLLRARSERVVREPAADDAVDADSAVVGDRDEPNGHWQVALERAAEVAEATGRAEGSRMRAPDESLVGALARVWT